MSAKMSEALPPKLAAYAKIDKNGCLKFTKTVQGLTATAMSEILSFMGGQYLAANQQPIFDALIEQCLGKYFRSRITSQFDPETDYPGFLLAANLLYSKELESYCADSTANKSSSLPVSSKTSTKEETNAPDPAVTAKSLADLEARSKSVLDSFGDPPQLGRGGWDKHVKAKVLEFYQSTKDIFDDLAKLGKPRSLASESKTEEESASPSVATDSKESEKQSDTDADSVLAGVIRHSDQNGKYLQFLRKLPIKPGVEAAMDYYSTAAHDLTDALIKKMDGPQYEMSHDKPLTKPSQKIKQLLTIFRDLDQKIAREFMRALCPSDQAVMKGLERRQLNELKQSAINLARYCLGDGSNGDSFAVLEQFSLWWNLHFREKCPVWNQAHRSAINESRDVMLRAMEAYTGKSAQEISAWQCFNAMDCAYFQYFTSSKETVQERETPSIIRDLFGAKLDKYDARKACKELADYERSLCRNTAQPTRRRPATGTTIKNAPKSTSKEQSLPWHLAPQLKTKVLKADTSGKPSKRQSKWLKRALSQIPAAYKERRPTADKPCFGCGEAHPEKQQQQCTAWRNRFLATRAAIREVQPNLTESSSSKFTIGVFCMVSEIAE